MKNNKFKNWSLKNKLRLFFGLFLLLIFIAIFYLKIVPVGNFSYKKSWPTGFFAGRGLMIDFRPGIRIDNNEKKYLKVISDPLYFNFYAPRTFDKLKVSFKYLDKLSKEAPIVELGILKGGENGNYELKPIKNKIIDDLKFSWKRVVDNSELLVLDRDGNYSSEEEFWADFNSGSLKNCAGGISSCAIFYNYDFKENYKPALNTFTHPLKITQALRGPHQFFVFFDKGDWRLSFNFRDLNLISDNNFIQANIYRGDILVESKIIEDDKKTASREAFNNRTFNNNERQGNLVGALSFNGQEEKGNLYKVEIKSGTDIVIEEINSSSDNLVFINHLWPVYNSEPITIFSDTKALSLKTFEVESLGKIYLNEKEYSLEKTYSNLFLEAERGINDSLKFLNELKLENSGVLIELNGVLALKSDKFFNPSPKKLDRFFSPDDGFLYLISSYNSPKKDGNYKVANLEFDLKGTSLSRGYYSFVVSIPGLILDETLNKDLKNENYFGIKEIKIKAEGKTLIQKIKEKLGFKI